MAYVDIHTPVIEKITLPSGNQYYIADREIRDIVDDLREAIAAGVSFKIAWDGTSAPTVAQIPAGVVVTYNGTDYTGTLAASAGQAGAFYLVKADSQTGSKDNYAEYVVVKPNKTDSSTWYWEKIGNTQVDLSDVVTDVDILKSSVSVIGTDSTFTITQPTIALETESSSGTGKVGVITSLGTPTTTSVVTGVEVTADPTISLTANSTTASGRIEYVEAQGTATTTMVSATASNGAVAASGDNVTALTGLGTPTTQSAVKSVTPTTQKLTTTSIYGVGSTTTTASKSTSASITYAEGTGTSSSTNTDWLKGVSVSNGNLTIGAATLDTATETFTDITVPIKDADSTTVATGGVGNAGGADIVTNVTVGDTFNAVTGYESPTTDSVLGTSSTFTVTDPTITLATGSTGDITVATGIGNATVKYLSADASGTTVGSTGTANAITGITPESAYIKATATGANTAWNNKDTKTVANYNDLDVDVTKGQ